MTGTLGSEPRDARVAGPAGAGGSVHDPRGRPAAAS